MRSKLPDGRPFDSVFVTWFGVTESSNIQESRPLLLHLHAYREAALELALLCPRDNSERTWLSWGSYFLKGEP